jgi:membrane-associated phospholipid phosphatase
MPIRPRTVLLGAGACLVLLALVWFGVAHVGFLRHADESGFLQFYDLRAHGAVVWLARRFVLAFDPNPYVYLVLVPLVLALLRGRPRVVLAIGAIVLGAGGTTELLKHVLVSPRPGEFVPGSAISAWPSGHSTAAMALALASVLAVPARLRPAATALGAVLAIAVGYSLLATGLHHPSDVLGGYLVAATWTLVAVGALLAAERRRPVNRTSDRPPVSLRAALGAPGAVIAGAAVLGLILAVLRPHDVISYARVHQAFVVEAAGIAALSLAVSTVVLLSVRR